MPSTEVCGECGAKGASSRCSRCQVVWYCNRACQKAAWKKHKKDCQQQVRQQSSSVARARAIEGVTPRCKCEVPGCTCTDFPMLLFRHDVSTGKEWFTGIVTYDENYNRLVKLDDPSGEPDGPGHDMTVMEYGTDLHHYDRSLAQGIDSSMTSIKMEGLHLRDFADKPANYVDPQEDQFDLKFPHGIPPLPSRRLIGHKPQIRSGDAIRVRVEWYMFGPEMPPAREGFWCDVVSITAFGIVTAYCKNNLNLIPVKYGDLIAFPVTCVVGVKHDGPYWNN